MRRSSQDCREFVLGCVFVGALGCQAGKPSVVSSQTDSWEPLFNGRTLAGWRVQVDGLKLGQDPSHVFSVRDGAIHTYVDAQVSETVLFGFLVSEKEFGDFALSFEYQWGGKKFAPRAKAKRDAGFLFHVHGEMKVWPRCVELQVQEGDTGDIFTVGTMVETTVDPTSLLEGKIPRAVYLPSESGGVAHVQGGLGITRIVKMKSVERIGWNTVLLEARGDEAIYTVNGEIVNRIRVLRTVEADGGHRVLDRGRLALQAEGAEVMYRNIKIRHLEP
jgi:hypothetical protein